MIKKRGQMKISFGMIFSLILIIVFIVVSFMAIKFLLGTKDCALIGKFRDSFEKDVREISNSYGQVSPSKEYFLPGSIDYLCFADMEGTKRGPPKTEKLFDKLMRSYFGTENTFLYPSNCKSISSSYNLTKIDLLKITRTENPYCIPNIDGKINLLLKKESGESLVTIER